MWVDHLECIDCGREFHLVNNDVSEVGCISCGSIDLTLVEIYRVEKS